MLSFSNHSQTGASNSHFAWKRDGGDGVDGVVLDADDNPVYEPIGVDFDEEEIEPFLGTFDGGGHTISGLKIESSGEEFVLSGLFGEIGDGEEGEPKIQNVHLEDIEFDVGRSFAGAIAGINNGIIQNCTVRGEITGELIGGIIASNQSGTIKECLTDIEFTIPVSEDSGSAGAGGIVLENIDGTVK